MNTLIVSDVFDAYYAGRQNRAEPVTAKDAAKNEGGKRRADAANSDQAPSKAA